MKKLKLIVAVVSFIFASSCVMEDSLIPIGNISFTDIVASTFTEASISCKVSGEITVSSLFIEYADNDAFRNSHTEKMERDREYYCANLSGLSIQTNYYYRYIASNKVSQYTEKIFHSFKTSDYVVPEVVTCEATNVSGTTATFNGEVTFSCGKDIIEQGFLVGENENDMKEYKSSLQEFSFVVSQLKYDTKYYYRAYAKSEIGRGEGETKYFTTCKSLSFNPLTITEVTATSASLTGGVADSGGVEIEKQGFRYKENNSSDIITVNTDSKTVITKLKPDTEYSVWCYAKTPDSEYEGELSSFKTLDGRVLINTLSPESVTKNSAKLKGSVSSDGGSTITERGFCYSTSADPTTSNNKIAVIGTVGEFEYQLWNLPQNTTYYVRAYAINGIGTFYGENISFTTLYDAVQFGKLSCSDVTASSVSVACSITSNGGSTVTRCGFCYSTSKNPTTEEGVYVVSGSTTSLVGTIKNLNNGTTYYIRAFATNANSTFYSEELSFITVDGIIQFTAPAVSNIAAESAIVTSSVISAGGGIISERGFCYGLTRNPTTSDNVAKTSGTVGEYSLTISGLKNKTVYYFRAYATNESGTYYSQEVSAVTLDGVATLSTTATTEIMAQSATLNGIITSDGGSNITERGFCYSTSSNPTTSSTKIIIDGTTGSVSKNVTGLNPATKYYVRVYAVNGYGTHYGAQESFTTSDGVVSFSASSTADITVSSFKVSTTISSDGHSTITKSGFCYSTSQNPTTQSNTVEVSGTVGQLSSTISGLTNNVTYYIRPFAVNAIGTYYGTQVSVKTLSGMADVSTSSITDVKAQSATFNGEVSSANGASITDRGFCYSTTENPTVSSSKVSVTGSTGTMTKTVSSLEPGTKYFVRAFATTSYGTSYGNQQAFTTQNGIVSFSNLYSSDISADSAIAGASVISDGGSSITELGICFSSSSSTPSLSDSSVKTSSTTSYSVSLSNLNRNTIYYYRAFAKNDISIFYSETKSFKTESGIAVLSELRIPDVGRTTLPVNCTVLQNGGTEIISRGFCYNTTSNPTTSSSKLIIDGTQEDMNGTISGLNPDTDYYIRAFATTKYETTYSNEIKAHTVYGLATLGPLTIANVTATTADFCSSIISDGGIIIKEMGFCYAKHDSPTIEDFRIVAANTLNTTATNLEQNETYFCRAYATTIYGTTYSDCLTFTTTFNPVVFDSISAADITPVSVIINCLVSSYGGNNVIEQGICYNIGGTPTDNDYKKVCTAEQMNNNIPITLLEPNSTYHIRAYVRNKIDSFYSEECSITTLSVPQSMIPGLFSVAQNKKVFFAKGNLIKDNNNDSSLRYRYYLAENQYDAIKHGGDITAYLPNDIMDGYGVISNVVENGTLLSGSEWDYVMNKRTNALSLRVTVSINGTTGLLVMPDHFILPDAVSIPNNDDIIDMQTWKLFERSGCVFLPFLGKAHYEWSTSGYQGWQYSLWYYGAVGYYKTTESIQPYLQAFSIPSCQVVQSTESDSFHMYSGVRIAVVYSD